MYLTTNTCLRRHLRRKSYRMATTSASHLTLTLSLTLTAACSGGAATTDTDTDTTGAGADTDTDTSDSAPLLELDGACRGPLEDPARIAVITTDFMSGGLSVADVAARTIQAGVAPATTDTVGTWHDGKLYLIHRYGYNRIDALDGASWQLLGGVDVSAAGVAEPNPQALAVAEDGRGYLTLFGAPELQIFDLAGPAPAKLGAIDLSPLADADGNPEAGVAIACGSYLVVGIQRLVDYVPVDHSYLVVLDRDSQQIVDLDPATPGPQGIQLAGAFPRQIRVDPRDPSGHTLLVLTGGLERVHLPSAARTWAIDQDRLAAVGLTGFAAQAFTLDASAQIAYLAAADGDYPGAAVWQIALDSDAAPQKIISGIATSEKVLERVGAQLWVGDTSPGRAGVRAFDLASTPPTELTAAPLDAGLPPYTFVPIP